MPEELWKLSVRLAGGMFAQNKNTYTWVKLDEYTVAGLIVPQRVSAAGSTWQYWQIADQGDF